LEVEIVGGGALQLDVLLHVALHLLFFFQAEDGIRAGHVTGVQTCALPIWLITPSRPRITIHANVRTTTEVSSGKITTKRITRCRSEERRVGKECRAGWASDE